MYNRKRIARGAGTAIAVWALIGLFIMSTGVAYALPLAGIGGFTITAEEVEADNLLLYPGVGDTSELSAYPQTITELEGPVLQDLTVSKTIDLGGTPGVSGNLRVSFVSDGETAGQSVLLKSSALQSRNAEFNQFSVSEMSAQDPRGQFQIQADGPVTLGGTGSEPVRIRAHYLATSSISLSNTKLAACYDPNDDGNYEYGPCDGGSGGIGGGGGGGNVAPSAVAVSDPNPASVGQAVTFDASSSYDPDGSIQSYEWEFPDGSTATGKTASKSFGSMGDFQVALRVTDSEGGTATDTVTVNVGTKAPNADASAEQTTAIPGEPVQFDGSGSSDPDGTVEDYNWNFGDGATGFGVTTTHSYASKGTYTVTLNVTDNLGLNGTDTLDVDIIENQPPSAAASVDNSDPNIGETVTFDASGSTDTTGSIDSYSWDFGDGSTGSGETATHSYSSGGEYTATVTATDSGGETDTATVTVDVNEKPDAVASVSPESGDEDDTYTFDASASSDPDGTIESYEWEIEEDDVFENSFTKTGETVSVEIDLVDLDPGVDSKTFEATLTVTDDDGETATDTVEYTVENCVFGC